MCTGIFHNHTGNSSRRGENQPGECLYYDRYQIFIADIHADALYLIRMCVTLLKDQATVTSSNHVRVQQQLINMLV